MVSLSACLAHMLFERTRHAAPEPAFTDRIFEAIQVLIEGMCPKARPGQSSMSRRPPVAHSRPRLWSPSRDHMLGAVMSLSWESEGMRSLSESVLQAKAPCRTAVVSCPGKLEGDIVPH